MTSTDTLIAELTANLVPVKRRRASLEGLGLAALGATEAALIFSLGAVRHDMGQAIEMPWMMWKIAALALLAGFTCVVAIRSFGPVGSPRRGLMSAAGLAALAIGAGMAVTPAVQRSQPLLDRLAPGHGVLCAASIIVLAMPLIAMLAMLMRRAAPARPKRSAFASGVAASTLAALVFTLACPMNDPLYVVVWYSIAVALVAGLARLLLPRRFRL